ncbi:MAG: AAA family ATPase [Promethearchaeota archaeon]
MSEEQLMLDYIKLLHEKESKQLKTEEKIVLEGQYKEAYNAMMDAYNAELFVGLIGPVGSGKTALCRKFANDLDKPFNWVTFSDLVRPSNLIGSFDPTLVFKYGFSVDAFIPGPFTLSTLGGGVFLANELNRGDEYVLNSLLDALEERKLYIPSLKTWYDVDPEFYLIAAMNPAEMRGTRRLPSAIKDRVKVWIHLDYPKKPIEQQIIQTRCPEYSLNPSTIELVLELVHQTRDDPAVELPASIRSSIGLARLGSERAKRLNKPLDNTTLAQSAKLVLTESIKMKPGRDAKKYVSSLLKRVLGTTG